MMACLKIGLRILHASKVKRHTRSLAAFPASPTKRLTDAMRYDLNAALRTLAFASPSGHQRLLSICRVDPLCTVTKITRRAADNLSGEARRLVVIQGV